MNSLKYMDVLYRLEKMFALFLIYNRYKICKKKPRQKNGIYLALFYGTMVFLLALSIYKDVGYSVSMPGDLRNRLVGARMMKDGLSPYFYIWKEGGPIRYYDTYTSPNSNVSAATATPFFSLGDGACCRYAAIPNKCFLVLPAIPMPVGLCAIGH